MCQYNRRHTDRHTILYSANSHKQHLLLHVMQQVEESRLDPHSDLSSFCSMLHTSIRLSKHSSTQKMHVLSKGAILLHI